MGGVADEEIHRDTDYGGTVLLDFTFNTFKANHLFYKCLNPYFSFPKTKYHTNSRALFFTTCLVN